jgi:hypothetical protein
MANKWVEHVRQKAQELGLTYGCAVSDPRVKSSYVSVAKKPTKKQRTEELVQQHYKRKEEKKQQEERDQKREKVSTFVSDHLQKEMKSLMSKVQKRKLYTEEDFDERVEFYQNEDYNGIIKDEKKDLWRRVKPLYKKYGLSEENYNDDFDSQYYADVIQIRVLEDIIDEN